MMQNKTKLFRRVGGGGGGGGGIDIISISSIIIFLWPELNFMAI